MDKWFIALLLKLLETISGPLREILSKAVADMEAAAKQTANPWDDIFVGCLKWLLGIK